jgi:pilus assembly protein CpaE
MTERSSRIASRRTTPLSVTLQEPTKRIRTTGGLVIAVYGARADVGVTTVATSLARAFRFLGSENVALAELDARAVRARSESLTGEVPLATIDAEHFDIPGLNAALFRQSDGVWTLAMTRPRTPVMGDAKSVTVALEAIRARFPVSIVELEHQVNERTLAAFDAADRIVIVTEGSVPSVRGTQRVLRLCRRLNYPDEKMCVVVNRSDAPGSLAVADISVALKREVFWKIGEAEAFDLTGLAEKLLVE